MHKHKAFQSTPSVWRETVVAAAHLVRDMYFNPLPPYGGRLASDRNDVRSRHFNPLPPYGGRPWIEMPTCTHLSKVQSTPSVWRETVFTSHSQTLPGISIHSLRMEGDPRHDMPAEFLRNFNPLPPYGGRLRENSSPGGGLVFQSTPSVWRETGVVFPVAVDTVISIHSLRMEGDYMRLGDSFIDSAFQSTPSVWRETNLIL